MVQSTRSKEREMLERLLHKLIEQTKQGKLKWYEMEGWSQRYKTTGWLGPRYEVREGNHSLTAAGRDWYLFQHDLTDELYELIGAIDKGIAEKQLSDLRQLAE